jgi:hypothetical protein
MATLTESPKHISGDAVTVILGCGKIVVNAFNVSSEHPLLEVTVSLTLKGPVVVYRFTGLASEEVLHHQNSTDK